MAKANQRPSRQDPVRTHDARTEETIAIARPAPLIAVTTSEIRQTPAALTPHGDPPQPEMALGLKYMKAIERAAGVPVVVPPINDPALLDALLARVSGVCLTGGPDLDPVAYGQRRHDLLGPTWRELDACELSLAKLADARHLPILGICRGAQTLNIARGGTLHQHVADSYGEQIIHRQEAPGQRATHWVTLTGPSQLQGIMRCRRTRVNSFHHQAIDRVGAELVVTSHAPDGTVESIEAVDRDFLIGVQWHAECLIAKPRQASLFRSFIEAARRFESGTQGLRAAA